MEIYKSGNIKLKLPKEIEKNLVEYQSPFMQEDTWMGLITEWLENYAGDLVCSRMLYNEALEMTGNPKYSEIPSDWRNNEYVAGMEGISESSSHFCRVWKTAWMGATGNKLRQQRC